MYSAIIKASSRLLPAAVSKRWTGGKEINNNFISKEAEDQNENIIKITALEKRVLNVVEGLLSVAMAFSDQA
jgi:hypothetical protein